jgi:hypothetical protein
LQISTLTFQILDLLTGLPLADADARRGPVKFPLLRDGQEIAAVAQFPS